MHEPKRIISIPKCNDCILRFLKDFVQILDFENWVRLKMLWKSIMVKYGKVSDREVQLCFHARIITIITVKVEFSRVLAFMMFWNDFFNFCKYDRFLVLLLHDLYFVVYFVWSLIRKKWETRSDANFSPFTVCDGHHIIIIGIKVISWKEYSSIRIKTWLFELTINH